MQLGNQLNQCSNKGSTTRFKIRTLSKLTQTKINNETTILEYLISKFESNMIDILTFTNDFRDVKISSKKVLLHYKANYRN